MKFLLDVCVPSRSLAALLTGLGHDVISAVDIDPRASDEQLLATALREDRILITEDKDFGELVFVSRQPHGTIVRLAGLNTDEQIAAMRELLERHAGDLEAAALITITRGRIRVRK